MQATKGEEEEDENEKEEPRAAAAAVEQEVDEQERGEEEDENDNRRNKNKNNSKDSGKQEAVAALEPKGAQPAKREEPQQAGHSGGGDDDDDDDQGKDNNNDNDHNDDDDDDGDARRNGTGGDHGRGGGSGGGESDAADSAASGGEDDVDSQDALDRVEDDGISDSEISEMKAQTVHGYKVEPLLVVGLRKSMKAYRAVQFAEKQMEAVESALAEEPKTLVRGGVVARWRKWFGPATARFLVLVLVRVSGRVSE
jgi:hypothetical protein